MKQTTVSWSHSFFFTREILQYRDYCLVVSFLFPYTGDPSISPPTSHFILHNKTSRHGPNLKFNAFEWYQGQLKRLFNSTCQVLLVSSGNVQKEWRDSEFNDIWNYSYKLQWTSSTLWFYKPNLANLRNFFMYEDYKNQCVVDKDDLRVVSTLPGTENKRSTGYWSGTTYRGFPKKNHVQFPGILLHEIWQSR